MHGATRWRSPPPYADWRCGARQEGQATLETQHAGEARHGKACCSRCRCRSCRPGELPGLHRVQGNPCVGKVDSRGAYVGATVAAAGASGGALMYAARELPRTTRRPVPLLRLKQCECKWPGHFDETVVGHYLFCGRKTDGHSYCVRHQQLTRSSRHLS